MKEVGASQQAARLQFGHQFGKRATGADAQVSGYLSAQKKKLAKITPDYGVDRQLQDQYGLPRKGA